MTILDIGGGRRPALSRLIRPARTTYVGLDVNPREFDAAEPGAYDRIIVGDAAISVPDLREIVDLAVSWQVFEHVGSLEAVLETIHGYLKPGAALVSLFSGRWSAFAVLNRLLPSGLGEAVVSRVQGRRALNTPIFPAYYDSCSARAVETLTAHWARVTIRPLYQGATYFRFSRSLVRVYLAYENVAARMEWRNAATHYLLVAER
jgi:cyclopropane fatty-acyl-phospholipid synthase-like methyltransferase